MVSSSHCDQAIPLQGPFASLYNVDTFLHLIKVKTFRMWPSAWQPTFPLFKIFYFSPEKNDLTNEIILDTSHYYFVFWSFLV